jgi:hypothetical protein
VLTPLLFFALSNSQVNAEAVSGLRAVGYHVDETPPTRSDDLYTVCGETIYPNINWTWDYEQNHLGDCGWDSFMVHYTGQIELPSGVTSVRFAIASDDGGWVDIGGHQFGSWQDQGCSITYSDRVELDGAAPLDAWVYENGGGTCAMLFWQLGNDAADWEIVPTWAFTTEYTTPTTTTTTTAPIETVPVTEVTTTTLQEATTSSIQASTSTSEPETTTTSTTTTTTTTTTTVYVQPPSAGTLPPATSSTLVVEVPPTSTDPEPVTTEPSESPQEEQPQPEPETTTETTTSVTSLPVDEPIETTTTTIVEIEPQQLIEETETANDVVAALEQDTPITQEQALTVVTSAAVLATISEQQAEQVFDAIDTSELTDSQAIALVEAVQEAPTEVRQAFEQEINVYSGKFDSYVPVGSTVPVSVRRTLVAAAATLSAVAAPTRRMR